MTTQAPHDFVRTLDGHHIEVEESSVDDGVERIVILSTTDLAWHLSIDIARQLIHDLASIVTEDDDKALSIWKTAEPQRRLRAV